MKLIRYSLLVFAVLFSSSAFMPAASNGGMAFQKGEWFRFRIHYGIFNASFATLEVEDARLNGKDVYHVIGEGKSTGMLHWFFEVDDRFESYFDKYSVKPYRFIRDTYEGGYTKDIQIDFNHDQGTALVNDKKHNKITTENIEPGVQDMISSFYHLRNLVDVDEVEVDDEFTLPMFFDKENFSFKLRFLGWDEVDTKFGDVKAMKFRPYVQAGRVFRKEESLTVWISADENKVPLRIKAKLAVGSLTADLDAFKGLKYSFKTIVD